MRWIDRVVILFNFDDVDLMVVIWARWPPTIHHTWSQSIDKFCIIVFGLWYRPSDITGIFQYYIFFYELFASFK